MKSKTTLAILMIGLLLALAACNLPQAPPRVVSPQDAVNTTAARTVAALSTDLAAGKNPTLQGPSATPITPVPSSSPADGGDAGASPTPNPSPSESAGGATLDPNTPCNRAAFVKDITIPDGSILPANTAFIKTWELKNTGSCPWNNTYTLVFGGSGSAMGGPAATPLAASGEVKPGESAKVSVQMRAPGEKGKYEGRWLMRAPDGKTFGVGANGTGTFTVQIEVGERYAFADLACSAAWSTSAGALACPGNESDTQGAVVQLENPRAEDGSSSEGMAILTAAQPTADGYIVGRYPAIMVPQESDFRALVGCREGAAGCYIRFKLTVQVDNGPEQTVGEWNEGADGNMTRVIADLDAYAGKPTAFNLYVYVSGTPNAAKGVWFSPMIIK